MATRRTFLKTALSISAAGAVSLSISARGIAPNQNAYYKVIFDDRFEDARAFAADAEERGLPTAAIRGDVTALFYDDLDLRWKQGPVLLAGYTTPAALFCLDLLARDRGMRVSHYAEKPGVDAASNDPTALVFWIIAPKRQFSTGFSSI